MSASEKLAALEATFEPRGLRKDVIPSIAVLVYAVPQIRALVEAAERVTVVPEGANPRHQITLREVLADLDKALS